MNSCIFNRSWYFFHAIIVLYWTAKMIGWIIATVIRETEIIYSLQVCKFIAAVMFLSKHCQELRPKLNQ